MNEAPDHKQDLPIDGQPETDVEYWLLIRGREVIIHKTLATLVIIILIALLLGGVAACLAWGMAAR